MISWHMNNFCCGGCVVVGNSIFSAVSDTSEIYILAPLTWRHAPTVFNLTRALFTPQMPSLLPQDLQTMWKWIAGSGNCFSIGQTPTASLGYASIHIPVLLQTPLHSYFLNLHLAKALSRPF